MKELKIIDLHKTYGTKILLDGVDLSIRTGDKIGLIGANGTGKSSLLKVIVGKEGYDQGEIVKPNDYTVAYLDQNPSFEESQTILETVYQSSDSNIQLLLAYEQARIQLENNPQNNQAYAQFNRLTDQMNINNAWEVEVRAKSILGKLGLIDLERTIATCSGGERKRIGIAQVLISEADLLILDEPTNHLDMQSIQWLENYLSSYTGALLLVTHDRYFLERAVNKIVELRQGHLFEYSGSYSDYLQQRQVEAEMNQKMQDKQHRLYLQELSWMRQGAKARTTKQQARINRFENLKNQVTSRNEETEEIEFDFQQQRIGQRIMDLEDVNIEVGQQNVIENFTKYFVKGDRLGIVGRNGVGKTTFLNTLAGLHPIRSGSYQIGQTVQIAYYQQLNQELPGDMRVLNYLTQIADEFRRQGQEPISASQILEQFNFPRVTHGMEISRLSGGERRRLYLLSLLILEPNVLFLDEPTNDLDIDTLQVLEDYLDTFQGVVVIVSHDRYFLDKTVDQIIELQGNGQYFHVFGNYSDYMTKKSHIQAEEIVDVESTIPAMEAQQPQDDKPQRMTYHEKQEWATLENDVMDTEAKIESIQTDMLNQGSDAYRLMELQNELEELEAQLMHYYERYEYLSGLTK